jgi:hypothetical protein
MYIHIFFEINCTIMAATVDQTFSRDFLSLIDQLSIALIRLSINPCEAVDQIVMGSCRSPWPNCRLTLVKLSIKSCQAVDCLGQTVEQIVSSSRQTLVKLSIALAKLSIQSCRAVDQPL